MYKNRVIDGMHGINMKLGNVLFILLILFMIALNVVSFPVHAQPAYQWAPDQKVPGYLDDTFTPYLIADQNRTVHAFVSQWIDDGGRRKAIVYRKWTLAGGWTRPVDILLAPSGNAEFLSAYLDNTGLIHVIFANDDLLIARIYYAAAPVEMADSSSGWSSPIALVTGISGVNSAALSGNGQGQFVIIYSGVSDGNGVYTIASSDAGQTWTDPKPIFLTEDAKLVPYAIKTYVSESGKIHVVWAVATSLGVYHSIYYAGLDADASQWSTPILLEQRIEVNEFFGPSFPVIVDNGKYVVVMYNSGNPYSDRPVGFGRPIIRVRLSKDGGQSWEEAINPFPFLVGNSGAHALVVDSNKVIHAIVIMRIDVSVDGQYRPIGGVWYSEFVDNVWSNPDRFVTTIPNAHLNAVVSQGNIILATWIEDLGVGQDGVWYSDTTIDAPELPVIPAPTLSAIPIIGNDLAATPVMLTPTPTLESDEVDLVNTAQGFFNNPAAPFIIGLIPVVLILIAIIVVYQYRRH